MTNEKAIKSIIEQVLQELKQKEQNVTTQATTTISLDVPDISEVDLQEFLEVENPENREGYLALKKHTSARLGMGRAGTRKTTKGMLRFQADHAAAMDAVFNDVSDGFLKEVKLFSVDTQAADKEIFLSNPELGRRLTTDSQDKIKANCQSGIDVQVIVSDGLSSTSIVENVAAILPATLQGLKMHNLSVGTPFFIKNGRVGVMDAVTELLKPKVTILFIGERPGLVTGESMSCYMTYKGHVGMLEAERTVISNIYQDGTPAVEGGAYAADLAKKMIDYQASGLQLVEKSKS